MAAPTLKNLKSYFCVHEAAEGTAFQPGERRKSATPAVAQASGEAHAEFMPTVCTHDPDQLPMKRSTGHGVCGGALDTGGVLAVDVELLKAEVAGTFEVTAVEGGAVEGGTTAVVVAEATI
jgi:hypothetical protein